MSKKNKIPVKYCVIIILFGIITSCQKEDENKQNVNSLDIMEARTWFESVCSDEIPLKSEVFIDGTLIVVPNWELALINNHQDSKTVEVPLIEVNEFGFTTEESYQAANEMGDKRFIKSKTTLVIEKKGSKIIGFLMTIIPDKDYLVKTNFEAFNSTYKKWQNGFSGYVLYHNLDGSFSNGWKLSEGNVIEVSSYASGKENTTKSVCYYYYLVLHITECGTNINQTKGTKGCIYYEEWIYMYNDCESNGGAGGGGGGGYVPIQVQQNTANLDKIYSLSSNLTPDQKLKLAGAVERFITYHAITNEIWNTLVSSGISLKFVIGPTYNNASAQVVGNTVTFSDEGSITFSAVREELIHRYQGLLYGSAFGTVQNYELEAKVLQDYISILKDGDLVGITAGYFDNSNMAIEYYDFMIYLVNTGYVDQYEFNNLCLYWFYPGPQMGHVSFGFNPSMLDNFIDETGIMY